MYRAYQKLSDLEVSHERMTYCNPVRDKIALINDQYYLLVGFLLFDRLKYGFTHRAQRIPSVENMEDNIRGIDNFVKFSKNTA